MEGPAAKSREQPVIARAAVMALVALGCAACANERSAEPMGLGVGSLSVIPSAAASELPGSGVRKSMAAKVLSSIAFERVTGLSTDPSRLGE